MKAQDCLIEYFRKKSWEVFPFQLQSWEAYLAGKSGLLNAPTGSGKTYALGLGILAEYLQNKHKKNYKFKGIQAIWITPIRALAKEIQYSMQLACDDLEIPWKVANRTGDTSAKERSEQRKNLPEFLITTPESLQLLLASKGYEKMFANLKCVVNDEWHELMGSKRGVQMELAHSRLKSICPDLKIWGISASIGNMDEALEVLLGTEDFEKKQQLIIKADINKKINIQTLIPDEIENFPWAGHLGIKMIVKIIPLLHQFNTTLIFTNTRSQSEIWYQRLLEAEPSLAGQIAMHHGSISRELRDWVEEALHQQKLKAVVCTSSLDLGVDFRPVDAIIQIGSPKGVARFIQRAGRSGHQPGAESRLFFVPTNSLELIEGAALKQAVKEGLVESRMPYYRSFDVLIQYMVSLAVSDGFYPQQLFSEITSTFSYNSLSKDEFAWLLNFISSGGASLGSYDEFKKVELMEDGLYQVKDRRVAMRHRLSMGTIVSDPSMVVKYMSGGYLGSIEESFISRLKPGSVFSFAGKNLELIKTSGMTAIVKRSSQKSGKVPSWLGGRLPLSSQLSKMLRRKVNEARDLNAEDIELRSIAPLIQMQEQRSHVPESNEFLIESYKSEGLFHAFFYPFEGRLVHEGMASVIAYRISLLQPISFSIALNDYGFELLSDQQIPLEAAIDNNIFSPEHLHDDIMASVNSTEMAKRKFRDIANIAGLIFRGYPGKNKANRHLQASSQLFFEVFKDYESDNLLLRQAFEEVLVFQLEESRMFSAFKRVSKQKIVLKELSKPSPFSFPIMVDRLRESLSSEKLEDRIKKMRLNLD